MNEAEIGKRIMGVRKAAGLSQQEFGDRITDPAIFIQTLLLMKKYPSLLIPYNIRN
jgi:hypothetical protein